MPIPARHLVQNQGKPVSVSLDNKLTHALALMIEHDFSQLPVVDADDKPLGIVTTDSITRALLTLGTTVKEPRVKDVFTKPPIFQADEDLLYLLDYLLKASAVFLVDADGKLSGIITDYDTTQYFRQRAEDIVLVEDIESTLKSHLRAVHNAVTEDSEELRAGIATLNSTLDETRRKSHAVLKEYCKNQTIDFLSDEANLIINKIFPADKAKNFDGLTLAEYIQLAHKSWSKLNPIFNISKNAWGEMMDAVREIRNKLVHFRGDVSPVERAKLRYCAEWYKTHQPIQKNAVSEDKVILEAAGLLKTESIDAESETDDKSDNKSKKLSGKSMLKYDYLGIILNKASQAFGYKDTYTITFSLIEKVMKASLPRAAYEHITWWTENDYRNRMLSQQGWAATSANLASANPTVTFKRLPESTPPIPSPETPEVLLEPTDSIPAKQ